MTSPRSLSWIVVGAGVVVLAIGSLRPNDRIFGSSYTQESAQDSLPEDVLVSTSPLGEVEFEHAFHVDDLEIECVDCHHETDAARLRTPHDEYFEDFWIKCDHCHHDVDSARLEAQKCTNCHPEEPNNIAEEILSSKVAVHLSCWECHETGTGAEASESCATCHTGPREPL